MSQRHAATAFQVFMRTFMLAAFWLLMTEPEGKKNALMVARRHVQDFFQIMK